MNGQLPERPGNRLPHPAEPRPGQDGRRTGPSGRPPGRDGRRIGTPGQSGVDRRHVRSRVLPLPLVVAIDIFLIGAGLVLFSLFHHVLPRDVGLSGTRLPQAVSEASAGQGAEASGTSGTTGQPAPGSAPGAPAGAFAARFPGKFTGGAIERTATTYRSPRVSITMSRFANGSLAYSIADIHVSDLKHFRTALAGGSYGRGLTETVLQMARRSNAVLALSGDYYSIRDRGVVIRNGVLYRESLFKDVLVLNNDGTMQTFAPGDFDIKAVIRRGAWQAWSFGPMLLKDGQAMTRFDSTVTVANPRGAIGYYEPGHYCFVLVDGRQPGYSQGLTMAQLSRLFQDLGCKVAYNLDGGESAVMVFQDAIFNRPYKDGRSISDIVCVVDG